MPQYCYTVPDGDTVTREFPRGEAPAFVRVRGRRAHRDYAAESVQGSVKEETATRRSGGWPMAPCFASGVNANQAQDLRDHYKKHGLNIHVTKDGDPVYESARQRRAALKCRNLHDCSSFD